MVASHLLSLTQASSVMTSGPQKRGHLGRNDSNPVETSVKPVRIDRSCTQFPVDTTHRSHVAFHALRRRRSVHIWTKARVIRGSGPSVVFLPGSKC